MGDNLKMIYSLTKLPGITVDKAKFLIAKGIIGLKQAKEASDETLKEAGLSKAEIKKIREFKTGI